jgi:hypothetical protein
MSASSNQPINVAERWSVTHPLTPEDRAAMRAMRSIVEPNNRKIRANQPVAFHLSYEYKQRRKHGEPQTS